MEERLRKCNQNILRPKVEVVVKDEQVEELIPRVTEKLGSELRW